ncbi:hypothetical protein [Bacillus phage Anath]|uniref:Uncharacterized protein n=1 Tax=Bacillus phage Anath TaxID=2108114 RepID=A0A2P1JUK3_9CAUD|nr:hypothetical protein [Bacillus phage Anath]
MNYIAFVHFYDEATPFEFKLTHIEFMTSKRLLESGKYDFVSFGGQFVPKREIQTVKFMEVK